MEQVNAVVDCDVARLNIPLRPWFARQNHGFVALLRRIPADVTGVFVRVCTVAAQGQTPATCVDTAAKEHADGSWLARVPATSFATAGERYYEVHGVACDDAPCALGEGRLCVQSFGAPPTPPAN